LGDDHDVAGNDDDDDDDDDAIAVSIPQTRR
jgi:hypothetical protein